jgi:hypothetical protein
MFPTTARKPPQLTQDLFTLEGDVNQAPWHRLNPNKRPRIAGAGRCVSCVAARLSIIARHISANLALASLF